MIGASLTLENLLAIYKAMNQIKEVDQSKHFKDYFSEVKQRIEELKK